MKQSSIIILVTFLMSMVSTKVSSHDIEVKNADGISIYYVWSNDKTELSVSYQGSYASSYNEYSGNVVIPSSVEYKGKSYNVTSIGGGAFYYCSGLTSITIPNSVTSIGNQAFIHCTSLTSITISENVTSIGNKAFYHCIKLTSITIPNSVTSIGNEAFYDCSGLTSITIPNSVTSIGNEAFYDCSGLTSITIPNSVTSIGEKAFSYCSGLTSITIANSVTSIGSSAFYNCNSLTSLTIPNSVTSIGSSAFYNCSSLTSLTIPNSVKYIGSDAFYGSPWYNNKPDGLIYAGKVAYKYKGTIPSNTSIVIKDGTQGIASQAFDGCNGLTSVTIPSSVTNIGDYAFRDCSSLVNVMSEIENPFKIGSSVFFGISSNAVLFVPTGAKAGYNAMSGWNEIKNIYEAGEIGIVFEVDGVFYKTGEDKTVCVTSGKTKYSGHIVIPSQVTFGGITLSVTSIGDKAFYDCSGLTSVTIPNSVASIEYDAFSLCSSLTSLTIPNSVTSIGSWAFYASGLTSITIPNSVTSIGENAFAYCSGLSSITIPNSVTSIGEKAFLYCSGLSSITIPNSVTSIGKGAFYGCQMLESLIIPEHLTSIDSEAFYNCKKLKSLTIPESVERIGSKAFYNCQMLESLTIPNSVTSIGTKAFCFALDSEIYGRGMSQPSRGNLKVYISDLSAWCKIDFGDDVFSEIEDRYTVSETWKYIGCLQRYSLYLNNKELTTLEIPNDITEIKANTFAYCNSIGTVKLHGGITNIGNNAFRFSRLENISGTQNVKSIGDYAFEDTRISDISLFKSLASIGKSAFSMTQLKSIDLSKIEHIGSWAFWSCTGLSKVLLPQTIKTLPVCIFSGCTNLTQIRIPSSVTTIERYAFEKCNNLKYVILEGDNLTYFETLGCRFQIIMPQTVFEKEIFNGYSNFTTYSREPMFVELKSKGATSAVLDVYPIDEDGSLDEKNMTTVTTIGQTPGQYLNWKIDKDDYGIISEKANETLVLTVQEPKALSTKKARLLGTVEEADDVEHYGFEWRRIDAPDLIASSKVMAPLYNGQIVGTLNNLNPDVYYKYRPFYKSDNGEMYYGEWVGLFTGDADVYFEPEVYTKDAEDITKVSALLAGVWFEGTDDFEEKGFEYWTISKSKTRAVGADAKKVTVSGNNMTTTLDGLQAGREYGYRSYAKTASGTTYGEEKTFKTKLIGDVDGDGELTKADAKAIADHIVGNTPAGFNKKMADMNDDKVIDATDIVLLVNLIK